ncbi:MAG TPA: MBL fold metallo-hydrolase [Polyangia bacterium]|jgi:glyoxylase-like metal-dependent hydrolase (beta-lactamase superfamily II)|nr:MBL fold metallo-hydrolase [Polyangia bacterium]
MKANALQFPVFPAAVSAVCVGLALAATPTRAQMGDPSKVTLKTTPVTATISMIEGVNGFAGGNVGVSIGDDGVFIIDDELQPMTAKLKTALAALSKKPVRFLVNTHWHSDHTGGNPGMAATGAVIVAQENVRKRLSVDQFREFMGKKMTFPALPPAALPVVTFTEDITLHLNGDEIHVVHVAPAHTDGDAFVHFKKANVIHAGDLVLGHYPIVDFDGGGTFDGLIAASDKILALADDATKIIPGHGALMTKADVASWRQMLIDVRDRIAKLVASKKSADEIRAAKPLADLDARWGTGMITADMVVEAVIKSPPAKPAAPDKARGKHHPR